jgi:hypothetical protein
MMSKIVIEIDTEEETITAKFNGKTYKDVNSVNFYKCREYESSDEAPEYEVCGSISLENEEGEDMNSNTYFSLANKILSSETKGQQITRSIAKMLKR